MSGLALAELRVIRNEILILPALSQALLLVGREHKLVARARGQLAQTAGPGNRPGPPDRPSTSSSRSERTTASHPMKPNVFKMVSCSSV